MRLVKKLINLGGTTKDSHFVLERIGRGGFLYEKGCVEMSQTKSIEYYLDSKIYSSEEVQKSISETKKQFSHKKVKVSLSLNNFGVYVITFQFESRSTYFDKIKIKFRKKFSKALLLERGNKDRLEQYSGENRYGQYKSTRTYRPY